MLDIVSFNLGPVMTNTYLLADTDTNEAAVIDPAWDGHIILREAEKRGWNIRHIWVSHAHFDHMGGTGAVVEGLDPSPVVALHPADFSLWQSQGGAPLFGYRLQSTVLPNLDLAQEKTLKLGNYTFEVRYAPGHTPGHVMFYCANPGTARSQCAGVLFSGDVIFNSSVGRTDLPGGDWDTLMRSIREQVLTLPDDTRILPGHMGETTVGKERRGNPFIR